MAVVLASTTGFAPLYASLAVILALFLLLGLVDDRRHIRPLLRLGISVAASIAVLVAVPGLELTFLKFSFLTNTFFLGGFGLAFTVLCLVGLQNAINMADGKNGLVIGLMLIWTVGLLHFAPAHVEPVLIAFALGLAIALPFNLSGRLSLGDSGTYQPVDEVFPGRSRHGLILWCPGLKGGSLMAMGQQKDRQGDLMVSWSEMPRSPGHVFYDRLQLVLIEGGFDGFAEAVCQPYYAARMGAPSVPPGRYFRMHLVGYFEGIDSERGLEWRCSDSLSLREFLLLEMRERVPDHSWLSRTRARLPHEVHTAVFDWVLALIAEAGLVKGERIGVDASTMEANAALRNIVRRDTGEGYRGMLERLAQESGIETPTAEDLARLDRKRKGKKLSNQDWVSRSDPEAKIAKMKDGTTHLAYKPEHAVDLDTGAVVAAELHPADEGDTTTLPKTLAAAEANLEAVDVAPTAEDPAECVTDKGYHSRLVLKALDDGPWKSRISEPKQKGFARWHGDDAARRAVTNNRTRLLSGVAREAFKLRAEIVERSFAHNLDRGGMRRTWLRGRENVHKRYLLHVAGHNLSLLMRQLIGAGTPKEAVAGGIGALFVLVTPAGAVLVVQIVLIVSEDGETAFAAICFAVA